MKIHDLSIVVLVAAIVIGAGSIYITKDKDNPIKRAAEKIIKKITDCKIELSKPKKDK